MQTSLISSTTKYGLIIGLFLAFNFLFAITNNMILYFVSNLFFILTFYYVYRYTVQFRDKERGGIISYREAFLYVLSLFFFGGIIYSGTVFIYCKHINPAFLSGIVDKLKSEQLSASLTQMGYSNEMLNHYFEILTSPSKMALYSIWGTTLIGVISGAIMGFFIKKNKKTTPENN